MDRQTFAEICRCRRVSWGSVLFEFMVPHTVRVLARAGYDWLWIDNEHSCHSYQAIQEVVRTCDDVGIMSILRVAQSEYALIARALDMGVSGIIVPRVETAEQMRHILDCAKFPPVGKRGFGFRGSHLGKRSVSMAERVRDQNEKRFLFIQIESRRGVENFESILDTAGDGINGVFFGPADFQMDLGKPDTPGAPELEAAARHITSVCATRSLSNGVPAGTIEGAQHWRGVGFNLITVGSDEGFLWTAAADARDELRALETG